MSITHKGVIAIVIATFISLIALFTTQITTDTTKRVIPAAHGAAVDYFLKIEGIEGESLVSGRRGEIDIDSWSWGETIKSGGSGGGGAGKVSMSDFNFTMKMSKASPKLMLAVATGERFKTVILTARRAADKGEFLQIKLSDVLVSGYKTSGSSGGIPVDEISMNFSKIEFTYTPQNADGTAGAPVKAGYDVKANKKI